MVCPLPCHLTEKKSGRRSFRRAADFAKRKVGSPGPGEPAWANVVFNASEESALGPSAPTCSSRLGGTAGRYPSPRGGVETEDRGRHGWATAV